MKQEEPARRERRNGYRNWESECWNDGPGLTSLLTAGMRGETESGTWGEGAYTGLGSESDSKPKLNIGNIIKL